MTPKSTKKAAAITMIAGLASVSALLAGGQRSDSQKPTETTLVGTITDLGSYMTGEQRAARESRRLIRSGIPVVLDTDRGPVVLGGTSKTARGLMLRLVFEEVEVKGMLYERHGLRYFDTAFVQPGPTEQPNSDDEDETSEQPSGDVEPGTTEPVEPDEDTPNPHD